MSPQQQALVNSVEPGWTRSPRSCLPGLRELCPCQQTPRRIGYLLKMAQPYGHAEQFVSEDRTYIDGYWGQCHWNTAMTAVRRADGVRGDRTQPVRSHRREPCADLPGLRIFLLSQWPAERVGHAQAGAWMETPSWKRQDQCRRTSARRTERPREATFRQPRCCL